MSQLSPPHWLDRAMLKDRQWWHQLVSSGHLKASWRHTAMPFNRYLVGSYSPVGLWRTMLMDMHIVVPLRFGDLGRSMAFAFGSGSKHEINHYPNLHTVRYSHS